MDEDGVLLSTAGLYDISFTFFVPPEHPRPTLQLRVNEKPVLNTLDSGSGSVMYHQDQMRHIQVTTYIQQVTQPAKVAITLGSASADYCFDQDSIKGIL